MRKLSNFEKLSLLTAASCRDDMKDYFVDVKKVAALLASGNEWALNWEYDFLEKEAHPLDAVVEETARIFDMFQALQGSEDAEIVKAGLKKPDLDFEGFDANNDDHFGVARVLVEELGRYTSVRGATANSHSSASLPRYRKMLARYQLLLTKRASGSFAPPTAAELQEILAA